MSKKTILLIDGCNLLHQSFHKFENLSLPMVNQVEQYLDSLDHYMGSYIGGTQMKLL